MKNKILFAQIIMATTCLASPLYNAAGAVTVDHADNENTESDRRAVIKSIYMPLADHYAGIIAYEKYRGRMIHAEYQIEQMKSWPLLRSKFLTGGADVAFMMSPLAMDMFSEQQNFRWVSLMHRDGNAMAINQLLSNQIELPESRTQRLPDKSLVELIKSWHNNGGEPIQCAVPSIHATHTVVLFKYLKDHGLTLDLDQGKPAHIRTVPVSPSKSPAFLKKNNSRSIPAVFVQSLPWADVVESNEDGHIAWYSKDVISWPSGHVECIAVASDNAIAEKNDALKEVIYFIHQAGLDIENARYEGGEALIEITSMIRKHLPEHDEFAIIQSLRPDLNVINYKNLNLDIPGLELIMEYAVEGGILNSSIDINAFADNQFSTVITEQKRLTNAVKGDEGE